MKVLRSIVVAVIALGIFGVGATNAAASDSFSLSQVNPVSAGTANDQGTTSSSVTLDANNQAKSFITPGTSIMGAAVSADPSVSFDNSTRTTHNDSWFFNCDAMHICGSVPISRPIPVQLTYGIKVLETQVTDFATLEFDANYQLQTGGSFSFSFAQDGSGDFELSAEYRDASGVSTDLAKSVTTTLNDGVYTLSLNGTVNDTVCGLNSDCIPETMSCASGANCSSTGAFTDTQSIQALLSNPDAGRDMIDGYDPFSIDIVSLDPNYQFISADGRTIGNAPTGGIPEPATWGMMLIGFAGIGWTLRRRGASAVVAG